MTKIEQWERDTILSQPVFDIKEDAINYCLEKYDSQESFPEVYQEPDGGKYLAADFKAFELLLRSGYERIAGFADLMRMWHARQS